MEDSGMVSVNLEDSIFNGKVIFDSKESILLLTPEHLVCREFANQEHGFSISLDQISMTYLDEKRGDTFHISVFVQKGRERGRGVQQGEYVIKCVSESEAIEWVETLQSVATDRNIRAAQQQTQKREEIQKLHEEAFAELKSIFPNLEEDVIRAVLISKGGDLQRSLDELLGINDPNYHSAPPSTENLGGQTTTPQEQLILDEQLALALQDELFMQQLQKDEEWRRELRSQNEENETSFVDKMQEMGEATKRKFSELYFKFKKATEKEGEIQLTDQEMGPISKKSDSQPAQIYLDDDDDDDAPLLQEREKKRTSKGGYQQIPNREESKDSDFGRGIRDGDL